VLDLTLVARDRGSYDILVRELPVARVEEALRRVAPARVDRFEVPGLLALKFVAAGALPGGVHASLRAGLHWQKAAIWLLLDLPIGAAPQSTAPRA
jgi:hypothetical protein